MAWAVSRRAALGMMLSAAGGCAGPYRNPGIAPGRSPANRVRIGPTDEAEPWPDNPVIPVPDPVMRRVAGTRLRATTINHATVLLQTDGLNILTDPIWSERASPVRFAGPRRVVPPGVPFGDLPPIDLVLVSHNHYDHLDLPTLKRLWERDRPLIVVPTGDAATLAEVGIGAVELAWDASATIGRSRVTLLPALHWSARGPFDRQRSLWGAYAIETPGGAIYFAGDTAYGGGKNFAAAAGSHGPFRLALLPIGAYLPRALTRHQHMDPDEAVRAHIALRSSHSIGIHFGTFRLTDERIDRPPLDLAAARRRYGVPESAFRALANGQAWNVPEAGA